MNESAVVEGALSSAVLGGTALVGVLVLASVLRSAVAAAQRRLSLLGVRLAGGAARIGEAGWRTAARRVAAALLGSVAALLAAVAPARAAAAPEHVAVATAPAVDPHVRTARSEVVVVRRGDTLWDLARRHLPAGATDAQVARAWPLWYAANRAVIGPDPGLLLPGQRLRVPGARPTGTSSTPHDPSPSPAVAAPSAAPATSFDPDRMTP